jgi:hypothetical protein
LSYAPSFYGTFEDEFSDGSRKVRRYGKRSDATHFVLQPESEETRCFLAGSNESGCSAVSTNGDGGQPSEQPVERPRWMTDELVEQTIRNFRSKTSVPFGEEQAVQVLQSLSQLLEATGLLKLEIDDEEEVSRMGESEQP